MNGREEFGVTSPKVTNMCCTSTPVLKKERASLQYLSCCSAGTLEILSQFSSLDAPGVNGRERDDDKERDEKAQASYKYRRSDRSDEPCWPRAVDDVSVAAEGACHLYQFQRRVTCRQGAPSCLDLDSFCEPTLFLSSARPSSSPGLRG